MSSEEILKYQGTLEKQCKLKTWAWKKYWFVLFNEQLCYYKEQESAKSSGGRRLSSTELGEIDLGQAHFIKEMKNISHGFPFEIGTKSRTYILSADKEESRGQWVKLLQQAMEIGVAKRRNNSIRSIKSSCNSIDEVDGYADIQTLGMNRSNTGNRTSPAPAPPTMNRSQSAPAPPPINRPESTALTENITEETDDELYTDIQTTENAGIESSPDNVAPVDSPDNDPYSYAVQMRKKTWKFMNEKAIDVHDDDDTYAEVKDYESVKDYDSVYERTSQVDTGTSASSQQVSNSELRTTTTTEQSEMPEYAQVVPKSQRLAKSVSAMENQNPNRCSDGDYVKVKDVNSKGNTHAKLYSTKSMIEFPTIPSLAHPRVEYTDRSHFDDIRLFLSRNRGMDEIYRDPPTTDLGGNSIDKLTNFLSAMNSVSEPEMEYTHL